MLQRQNDSAGLTIALLLEGFGQGSQLKVMRTVLKSAFNHVRKSHEKCKSRQNLLL